MNYRIWLLMLGLLALAACGGGGGGGGGSGAAGGGAGGGGTPTPQAGAFTLSGTSLSFDAFEGSALPAGKSLAITVTGSGAAFLAAGYAPGETRPPWLGIDIVGSGTSYNLVVTVSSMQPGTYSTTFLVGTADSAENILQTQSVTVTYTVTARIAISGVAPPFMRHYAEAITTLPHTLNVVAPNRQWTVASDQGWLQAPAAVQNGTGAVQLVIDLPSLKIGNYDANVTVTNAANPLDTATQRFSVSIAAPTLSIAQSALVLGGADGRSSAPQQLAFALNAGGGTHPYSVSLTTASGGNWLTLNPSTAKAGVIGPGGVTLTVDADRAGVLGGTYSGTANVAVTVRDVVVSQTVPVTLNLEASRIVVGAAGVAFKKAPAPARSVLTRDVTVFSSLDRTDVPWTASANQPWLTVTPSGVTGERITLTASPSGLAADTTHFATVTVTSSDPSVENVEQIRVGFRINSAVPSDGSVATTGRYTAASPVEPIVFVSSGGASITGYDVDTLAVVRTFTGSIAAAGQMVMSDDGNYLFVFDRTNLRVTQLDATSGAFVRHYDSFSATHVPTGGGLAYVRPGGYRTLITPAGRQYDVGTGLEYSSSTFFAALNSESLAASADQVHLVTDYGSVYRMSRTSLNGGSFATELIFSTSTVQGRQGQACISADRTMVYTASGYPYNFPGTSMTTHQVTQVLPGTNYPNAIQCLWNGVIIGGVDGYYAEKDVFVYFGPTGQELAQVNSSTTAGYRSLVDRGLAVSGDTTRLVTVVEEGCCTNDPGLVRFQSLPAPP
jgi:hypothetical protein